MRLPTTDGQPGSPAIDEAVATSMLRLAIEGGVNFIDTAYPYHGERSEIFLSRALSGGYRERVMLATKCPVWMITERTDFRRCLEEQLRRLETESIDFYMFHGLNQRRWDEVLRLGLLEEAERAVREGLIAHLGFSFHDRLASFQRIVDGYDGWTVALIQYNYMDVENQAGTEGLKHAARRGLGVAVMEPLLGGCLASPPPDIADLFR
ncbi:MAG: aldo/keto reductase, partial [Syntrophales bacterium]|nr:aldo/keto reductase [Syntrophales bacterium]